MGDVVQFKLERMLNELDDFEKRGLFTRREIAEIVKQRRKFEFRLKRPSPLKEDFLAYIEYEKRLDKLRILRKKAANKEATSKLKKKKSVSDFTIVTRIIDIYRIATTRFKGDVQLWFQYLEFCRQRRNGRMKKALAQVVRFHPKVPGVWIYAAAWEFDHNLNVESARSLMQRGLRACPASEDLWVEYLRMELTYLNKLKTRKVVLGEDEGTLNRERGDVDEKQWIDQNKDLFMPLNDEKEDHDGELTEKQDPFKEQGLKVLQVVYAGAIVALPSSFDLRRRFLEILEATDLSDSGDMRERILSDMKRDFSSDPGYWDWLARLEGVGPGLDEENMSARLSKAIQIYEEGLIAGPSAALFDLYVKFLMEAIDLKNDETQIPMELCSSTDDVNPITHLLMTYEKAVNLGCITKDLACQHVSLLMQLGRLDEARFQVEKYCSGIFSDAVDLWALRVSIETRCAQEVPISTVLELLKDVLTRVSITEAKNLWLMALELFTDQRQYLNQLVEISIIQLTKDGGSDAGFSLSSAIVNYFLQTAGVQKAREMYKRFLALPHPGLELYRNSIVLELNLAATGDKKCLANARNLYESALTSYDQDIDLWRDYYLMEVKMGTSETAASVHWRARKCLKGNFSLPPTPSS